MALQFGGGTTFSVEMEGPFGNTGTPVKVTTIHAPAANWKGAVSPYSQTVELEEVSLGSKVDLQLDAGQLNILRSGSYSFVAGNEDGTITLYAIGDLPTEDLVFQATVTEVTA